MAEGGEARAQIGFRRPLQVSPLLAVAPAKVFYIGMQKAGTSSFSSFCYELGLVSYHASSLARQSFDVPIGCQSARDEAIANANALPNYAQWLEEIDSERLLRAYNSNVDCFADNPFEVTFQRAADLLPDAKFVVWRRPTEVWVDSVLAYFCAPYPDNHTIASMWMGDIPQREFLLNYAKCDLCNDFRAGGDREMSARSSVAAAYLNHLGNITERFSAADQRARLLEIDYEAEGSARQLCEFILGNATPTAVARCALYGTARVPNVEPTELTFKQLSDSVVVFDEAVCGSLACLQSSAEVWSIVLTIDVTLLLIGLWALLCLKGDCGYFKRTGKERRICLLVGGALFVASLLFLTVMFAPMFGPVKPV